MTGMDESWRDESVIQRNLHLLNSGLMADCTFVVGTTEKKRMQCHKFVLSQGSSVFYAMFNGELQEKGEVKVEDIEPQNFRKMLEFIYSDNTELENVESALSICYAANKYMINTLTTKCINFIKTNMNADIVIGTLEFARLIDNADLEAESLQYLKNNTCDVLKSASLPNAERVTLLTILSQDTCDTSEVELFSACIRWAKAKRGARDSLREVLGPDILSLIRFLTMSTQEFATVVIPSKLLQLQEEQDILCRLVTGTGNMPQGFNTSKDTRAVLTGPREIVSIRANTNTSFVLPSFGCNNTSIHQATDGQTMNNCPCTLRVNVECVIYGLQLGGLSMSAMSMSAMSMSAMSRSSFKRSVNASVFRTKHAFASNCTRAPGGFAFDGAPVEDKFDVKVNLLEGSQLLASAEYKGLMSHGKNIEINFDKPVLLKANINYTLQMKYSNIHLSYDCTQMCQNEYITSAGVIMNVNSDSNFTSITQIYIARKIQ
ncbi:hypothetical protein B566_EDAN007023 [Ephemera danica]|nr:hypothetical protein B566_EDAN007023 [Ephemera danica]